MAAVVSAVEGGKAGSLSPGGGKTWGSSDIDVVGTPPNVGEGGSEAPDPLRVMGITTGSLDVELIRKGAVPLSPSAKGTGLHLAPEVLEE